MLRKILSHRYGPVFLVVLIATGISFITRIALLFRSASGFEWSFLNVIGSFSIGLFYDLCVSSYVMIPFILHLWWMNERVYEKKYRWITTGLMAVLIAVLAFTSIIPKEFNSDLRNAVIGYFILRLFIFIALSFMSEKARLNWRAGVLYFDFILMIFLLLFNGISEWFFWDEFSTRYNFSAVDYLVYTNEVIGNIRESYPVVPIILGVLAISVLIFLSIKKYLRPTLEYKISFVKRSIIAIALLLVPALTYTFVSNKWKKFSQNEYANELAGNGIFDFGTAF